MTPHEPQGHAPGLAVEKYVMRRAVRILYTNYVGKKRWRNILPISIHFGTSAFHPGQQWILEATDLDKEADRSFALKDIHEWQPVEPETFNEPTKNPVMEK